MKTTRKSLTALSCALALLSNTADAGLFDFSSREQNITTNCYTDINMPVTAAYGAQVQINMGNCHIETVATMGKAGDIVRKVATNTVSLGKAPTSRNGIATPAAGQSVALNFAVTSGQLNGARESFLIEHVSPAQLAQELADRDLTQAARDLKATNPKAELAMFVFYRSIQGMSKWEDLGQTLGFTHNVNQTFNVSVDATGKLVLSTPNEQGQTLFDISKLYLQRSR